MVITQGMLLLKTVRVPAAVDYLPEEKHLLTRPSTAIYLKYLEQGRKRQTVTDFREDLPTYPPALLLLLVEYKTGITIKGRCEQ